MFHFYNRQYYRANNYSHFRLLCRRMKGRQYLKKKQGLVCKRNKNTWKIYLSFNCIFFPLEEFNEPEAVSQQKLGTKPLPEPWISL